MYEPILIAGPARSGTSMIAGLLHLHGVLIGESKGTRYPGSNTPIGTENLEVKRIIRGFLKTFGYRGWNVLSLPIEWIQDVQGFKRQIIDAVGPEQDQRWLVKTAGILYFPNVWMESFPGAYWIFPRRAMKDIISSMKRHPAMRRRAVNIGPTVKEMWRRQDYIARTERAFYVDPHRLVHCPARYAQKIFDFCELDFDKKVFNSFIDSKMWHGGTRWTKKEWSM